MEGLLLSCLRVENKKINKEKSMVLEKEILEREMF